MEKENIILKITGRAGMTPFLTAATYELAGRCFDLTLPGFGRAVLSFTKDEVELNGAAASYRAVKIEDERFLIGFDEKLLVLEVPTLQAILTDGDDVWTNFEKKENPLTGWETEIHFGAYMNFMCSFETESVTIDGQTFPASFIPYTGAQCFMLLDTKDGKTAIITDIDRFLIYGGKNGEPCIGGCIEVPEE